MSVNIGTTAYDGFGDFALVMPDYPDGYDGFGDFDVDAWDQLPDMDDFGDLACGCGLGAPPAKAEEPKGGGKKFPWGVVAAGAAGLALGVGVAFGLKKLLKK